MLYLEPTTMTELRESLDNTIRANELIRVEPMAEYVNFVHHNDPERTCTYTFRYMDRLDILAQITTHVRLFNGTTEVVRFAIYDNRGGIVVTPWFRKQNLMTLINSATSRDDCILAYSISNILGHGYRKTQ